MRKQQIVSGMNNSQKIRFMVNGFGMYCKVSDIESFATSSHRVAVISALQHLQCNRDLAKSTGKKEMPVGFGTRSTFQGVDIDVQVDLV
jgi:hypothetical protein